MSQSVGSYLKKVRIEKQITQKEAADHLGLTSPQYISNFERGLCEPSIEHAMSLSMLYKIKTKDLYQVMIDVYKENLKEKMSDIKSNRRA